MINIIYPTILIHGIGGDSGDLINLQASLENRGVPVYNIDIGNGKFDSIFMNMNKQCDLFGENIENLSIDGKINLIGISQGGLLARCYVEKYSHKINQVHSLITYGTPHMGFYHEFMKIPYLEYWKNPYKYNDYLETNDFLVYLNNEKYHENMDLYRMNLSKISYFVLIWSEKDSIINPIESAKFEFYNITEGKLYYPMPLNVVKLSKSNIFINDSVGLKYLFENNALIIKQYGCNHEEFKSPKCYLNASLASQSLLNFTIKYL